jgi:hypothetical protein
MKKTINKITSVALSATTVVWLTGAAALMPVAANAQSVQDQIQSLLAQIATLQAQLASMQGSTATTTSSVSCNFTRSLTMGSKGDDVKCLQKYLNSAGHQLASSGAGSPGNETTYFGSITKAGVIKWQNANASTVLAPVGLSVGTGYFGPSSRSAYASMVASSPGTPGTPSTPGAGVPSGSLTYSLAADNPASSNIPKGASEVTFMKLAVSGSGTVDSLKFKRTGLGATADFVSSGVKLYEGSTRLTTGKSVNGTSHEVIFPNLKLDVSGLRTISLTSDISSSATAGNINAFELIEINGEALASPIKGNSMNIGGASVGTVTVAKVGSQPSNPTVGEVGAKITEFKVTAGTVEDVEVRRIVLTDTGSITNGYLTNLVMKQAGNVVATTAGVTGRDMFVFELDSPFKVLKGQNRSFEVFGDISPLAKKDDTVDLYMDLTNDAHVTGLTYGYGVTVTNSFTSSLNHSALTLQGAEITITFNGPNARDIAKDAQDVTLFDFSIATKNNVEIKSIGLLTSTTGLTASTEGFADFKLVDAATGAAVTTSVDIANNTSSTQTFTDVINIAAGTTRRFLATADVDTNNPADSSIKVTLTQFAGTDIRNLDNNQDVAIADIVPNAKIVGNAQTVQTPGLALTLAGSPPAHNIVGGNTNEKLLGFNLKASSGDIKVTQVAISVDAGTGTDAQAQNDLRTIGLYVDNQLISEKKNLSSITSANQATFSQVNYTVPDGQTKTVEVRADLVATDATSANVYFAYLTNTDVTATDTDGNSVTPSGTNINGSVGSAGSITVTVATPSIQIVKVNNTVTEAGVLTPGEQTLAQWDFFAKESEAQINKLRIGVASTTTIDASSHDSLAQEVKEIRLYDGSTLLGSGVPAASGTDAGVIKLENSSGIVTIPANTVKQLTVKAVLGDCADSSCSSYTLMGLSGQSTSTDDLVAFIATSTNFEAVSGNTTITSITSSDGQEVGNVKRLYKSFPTITVSSPSSSILSTGEVEALKFTIAADSSGDIEVGRLEINVVTAIASITADTVTIRSGGVDIAESSTIANLVDVAGGADGIIEFTTPERITAGTSKTYSLFLDVTAVSSGSDSLVTKLKGDATDYVTPETFAINSQGTNSFVWSDMAGSSGSPHSTSTTDWHNGFNLKTLPSGAKGLTKS